jgi:predicted hydrocarbon binding protein
MNEEPDRPILLFDSFAEAISTLERLSTLESKISAAIEKSHTPWKETRKLLKCVTPMQASNTPLIQFLQDLFIHMSLGKLNIISVSNIQYVFSVRECEICKLYHSVGGRKVCYIISDALASFFLKDLTIPCTVEEIKCSRENGTKDGFECEFRVDLDPLSVYTIALDDIDKDIVKGIAEKTFDITSSIPMAISQKLDILIINIQRASYPRRRISRPHGKRCLRSQVRSLQRARWLKP